MKRSLIAIKKSLAEYLQERIDQKIGLGMTWNCYYCRAKHAGNLLKKVSAAVCGLDVGDFKPDISLLDEQQNVFGVIQLSTKQKLDESALAFYNEQSVIYLQIKLESQDELESLKAKLAQPDFVGTCFNPKCRECGHFLQKTIMTIIDEDCYKCKHPMKVAVIEAGMSRGGTCVGPERFTPKEIELASGHGVLIGPVFSKTRQEQYSANLCPACNAFVGQHYLFTDYLSPAGMGYLKHTVHEVGYYCDYCTETDWAE